MVLLACSANAAGEEVETSLINVWFVLLAVLLVSLNIKGRSHDLITPLLHLATKPLYGVQNPALTENIHTTEVLD